MRKIGRTAAMSLAEKLRELREANNRLEKLCNPKPENQEDKVIVLHGRAIQVHEEFIPPIDESEAEDAMNEFDSTLDQLRDLQGDVDMSAVDPNFWGKVDAEEERNGRVRESCCETHRGDRVLDCESILGPITP